MQDTSIPYNKLCKEINKQICEAIDCFKNATDEISLKVGKFGKISLFLCKECLPKFTTIEVNENIESQSI
jgi:hypothetical protein